jgi:formamidopyrimidine-DNA glycosylase
VLEGRRLTRVETRRPDLRRAFPEDLGQRLTGAKVIALRRRAKYGLIDTDRGDTLVFHLGMSGRWRIDPFEIDKHDHLVIETNEGRRLSLNDPRRFGSLDLVETIELDKWTTFSVLGPEPMDLDPAGLQRQLKGRSAAIKLLLLDQRIVAGLGNIYVCEALSRSHLSPKRRASTIADRNDKPNARAEALVVAIKAVLQDAIKAGGSTLRDHRRADGSLGDFQHTFQVYDRERQPCPNCKGIVKRIVQSGRSTFYCSSCQK